MKYSIPKINPFVLVYWGIALATAYHTAWGAATTMQGAQQEATIFWWLQGIAFALAIDFTMVAVASKIRGRNKIDWKIDAPYLVTFAVVAIASTYFQLLYAWAHTTSIAPNVGGVAQVWVERLQGLIDARVVIAPLALPLIAVLYTIAGLGKGGEVQSRIQKTRNVTQSPQSKVAIHVDSGRPQLSAGTLPEGERIEDDEGKLAGYACPGCGKELSISGWSRHKRSCDQYLELQSVAQVNGHH